MTLRDLGLSLAGGVGVDFGMLLRELSFDEFLGSWFLVVVTLYVAVQHSCGTLLPPCEGTSSLVQFFLWHFTLCLLSEKKETKEINYIIELSKKVKDVTILPKSPS